MFYIRNNKNGKLLKTTGELVDKWTYYVPSAYGFFTMKYAKKMSAHLRRLGMNVKIVEINF